MKAMISQPMRGRDENEIILERIKIEKLLKNLGFEIINTLFDFEDKSPLYYLAKSIEAMSKVDVVVFAPEWEKARGCKIEFEIAKEYEKSIVILPKIYRV